MKQFNLIAAGVLILLAAEAFPQSFRGLINDGVDLYKDGKYSEAEVNFKKGLGKDADRFEANFNLGDAYYKQQRFDEALEAYHKSLTQAGSESQKAKVYHNIGNALLKSQKLQESIEAYKNALKLNPDDRDTKYNLSYALSLLNNQQQNKQQQNQQDKNQNKDQPQNDQQNNNDQNQEKKDQQNQQDQNRPDQNQTAQQDNLKQPEKNKISKEEAERILEALKNNEKDLQKQLRKKTGKPVKVDKDW
jgi:tetratricopeptide (TPR) repeat protein